MTPADTNRDHSKWPKDLAIIVMTKRVSVRLTTDGKYTMREGTNQQIGLGLKRAVKILQHEIHRLGKTK